MEISFLGLVFLAASVILYFMHNSYKTHFHLNKTPSYKYSSWRIVLSVLSFIVFLGFLGLGKLISVFYSIGH